MHFEPDSPPMLIGRLSLACETTLCASGFHLEIIPVSPIHLPSTVKLEVCPVQFFLKCLYIGTKCTEHTNETLYMYM